MSAGAPSGARRPVRRAAAMVLAGLLPVAVAISLSSGHAAGDSQQGGLPVPEPDLSLPAAPKLLNFGGSSFVMLGADTAREAFAYTLEPSTQTALSAVGGQPIPSDWTIPQTDASRKHFVLFRYDSGGWHVAQEALDRTGAPLPSFQPTGYSTGAIVPAGQVSPGGAATIAGTDGSSGPKLVLVRDPGGTFRAAPAPPAGLLGSQETLFDSASPAIAPVDDPGHGGVFVAPFTNIPSVQPLGVLHYDGTAWTREPIVAPSPQATPIKRVLAISAASPSNAYLLALTSDPSAGVALFKREVDATGPHWVGVQLDGQQGSRYAASSGPGYSQLGPLHPEPAGEGGFTSALAAPGAQPLTATPDGAWVDGAFADGGATRQFTLHVAVSEQSGGPHGALHAWCNDATVGLCDDTAPEGLPDTGYRSIAWSGAGPYGSRILTGLPGGAILSLQGTSFKRVAGVGDQTQLDGSAAFLSPTEGWTGGAPPTRFTQQPDTDQLQAWPTPFRQPLTAITGEPGHTAGAINAQAIAVGADGEVARYTPGQGWSAEPLLTPAGVRATPRLRSVAWPEEGFAYAVGDGGDMWRWQRTTGIWERDPATPQNFAGDLTGVAFAPTDPSRGYAVGLNGVLLRYDKTWTQEPLPAGLEHANFTSITFAGSQAIVAFLTARPIGADAKPSGPGPDSGLLVNDGGGWHVDTQEQAITTPPGSGTVPFQPAVNVVAGLPDGGAVAAGHGVILERDAGGAPWHLARDPLPGYSVVAAAAIRDGSVVRALLSVDPLEPAGAWPTPSPVSPPACSVTGTCVGNQGLPTLFGPYDLPASGWLLRETPGGWQDVQHNAYPTQVNASAGADNPARDDEVQALLVDSSTAQGWAVGGEAGIAMNPGTASNVAPATNLHTAGIYRYPPASTPPTGASTSPPPLTPGNVTVALAGGARCFAACGDRYPGIGLGPPTWLDHAVGAVAALSAKPGGPRAFIYTGGIVPDAFRSRSATDPSVVQELSYFAGHAQAAAGSLPFAPVISSNEVFGGAPADAFMQNFSLAGLSSRGRFPDYYAFDVSQPGSSATLRVVVIDVASALAVQHLANEDPSDPQYEFLTGELTGARSAHVPVIVVGSRTLSTQSVTGDSAPSGATAVAKLLVSDGASAYFFESPDRNARYDIPAGGAQTIPSYGTGSLSYDAWASAGNHFGESGYLLASVDPAKVDPSTNRAPVTVRLIPNVSELAIDARDGTTLRRSQISLFQALARRARAGTGQRSAGNLVGPDPYIAIPPSPCSFQCAARMEPEFSFSSSNPDIANFVEHDPASLNPRSVFLDSRGKPVPDSKSGLLCAFNAGHTTLTVTTGGLSFSESITVVGGTVKRPCGTVPLINPPLRTPIIGPSASTPPPPSSAPPPAPVAVPPTTPPVPPPPLVPTPIAAPLPPPVPAPPVAAPAPPPFVPQPQPVFAVPPFVPTLAPPPAQPIPPSGSSFVTPPVTEPVAATKEKKEEEHATEQAQQFSAYSPPASDEFPPALAIAMAIALAAAGATVRRRGRQRRTPAPALEVVLNSDVVRRRLRRRMRGGRR